MNYHSLSILHIVYHLFSWLHIQILTLFDLSFAFLFICFKNFFSIKVFYCVCLRNSIFTFFDHKNFFRAIWRATFFKIVFMFWYSYMVANLNLGSLSFFSTSKIIDVHECTSTGFILIVLWYVLLCLLTISSNLSIYTFFDIKFIYL